MIVYTNTPKSFILQWHITEKCNWHCKHCYQNEEDVINEEPVSKLQGIIGQYVSLIKRWGINQEKARIHLAGGEPLLRKDFFELVEILHHHEKVFKWGVLSNGSLIDNNIAKKLKKFGAYFCQISIEGCEGTNDSIRGKGSFKKASHAVKCLVRQNIPVRVSLTFTERNIKDVPKLVNLFKDMGVSYFSTRRLVPQGRGKQFTKDMLNRKKLFQYYKWVEKTNKKLHVEKKKLRLNIGCDSGIFNNEKSKNSQISKNFCGILNGRILVVMPNGDVMPCRRLPIIIGNVFDKSLDKIWKSNLLRKMRNMDSAHKVCKHCKNFENCFGGAKCVTYACTGKFFIPDVACLNSFKTFD